MKKFMLFISEDYYPGGGMFDFVKDFDTLQEAKKYREIDFEDYGVHVLNIETREVHFLESGEIKMLEDLFNRFKEQHYGRYGTIS